MTGPSPSSPGIDTAAYQDTDDAEVVKVLAAVRHCANSWDGSARLVGNVRARDISRACTAAITALQPSSAESTEYRYAKELLVSFVNEHCDPVPAWKPNDDLMGILIQFDNALTVVRSIKAGLDPKRCDDVAQPALTWEPEAKPDASCHYDHTSASTPFGTYRIEWKSWKDCPQYSVEFEGHFVTVESKLEDAKGVALDDFNRRLRACTISSTTREGK